MALSLSQEYDKIYKYCYFKTRNAPLAEDLTQETFLKFYSQNSYVSYGKRLAYLYTIARNLCTDICRKADTALPVTGEGAGEDVMDGVTRTVALKEAVDSLPPDLQELILLRYANDLSMTEISGITGMSRFAIGRKLKGAVEKLKLILKKEDFM